MIASVGLIKEEVDRKEGNVGSEVVCRLQSLPMNKHCCSNVASQLLVNSERTVCMTNSTQI